MSISRYTLKKEERISSKKAIEHLFSGHAASFSAYPFRVVYEEVEKDNNFPAAILISVSKRRFKHAVKRNKVKRQIREAYRKNKHNLSALLTRKEKKLNIAFIYLDNKIRRTEKIEKSLINALNRLIQQYES